MKKILFVSFIVLGLNILLFSIELKKDNLIPVKSTKIVIDGRTWNVVNSKDVLTNNYSEKLPSNNEHKKYNEVFYDETVTDSGIVLTSEVKIQNSTSKKYNIVDLKNYKTNKIVNTVPTVTKDKTWKDWAEAQLLKYKLKKGK